jgi:hypothetical protein
MFATTRGLVGSQAVPCWGRFTRGCATPNTVATERKNVRKHTSNKRDSNKAQDTLVQLRVKVSHPCRSSVVVRRSCSRVFETQASQSALPSTFPVNRGRLADTSAAVLALAATTAVAFDPSNVLNRFPQSTLVTMKSLNNDFNAWPTATTWSAAENRWVYAPHGIEWTSGFFPGLLYMIGNQSQNDLFTKFGHAWTVGLTPEDKDNSTHDGACVLLTTPCIAVIVSAASFTLLVSPPLVQMIASTVVGFMVFDSFGDGIVYGGEGAGFVDTVLKAAHTLAERWNPVVGMIRSWGAINNETAFEVIIDNLMNLELLLWAGQYPGKENSTLVNMAISHADNTFKYWTRPDGSTFHLGKQHDALLRERSASLLLSLSLSLSWYSGI